MILDGEGFWLDSQSTNSKLSRLEKARILYTSGTPVDPRPKLPIGNLRFEDQGGNLALQHPVIFDEIFHPNATNRRHSITSSELLRSNDSPRQLKPY